MQSEGPQVFGRPFVEVVDLIDFFYKNLSFVLLCHVIDKAKYTPHKGSYVVREQAAQMTDAFYV